MPRLLLPRATFLAAVHRLRGPMVGSESPQPQLPSQVPGRHCGPTPQVCFSSYRTKNGPAVLRTLTLYLLTHLCCRALTTMSLCGPKLLGEKSLVKGALRAKL